MNSQLNAISDLTVRQARRADVEALKRLAALDSHSERTAEALAGDALVAESGGELIAAVSLDGAGEIANPFRRTADVVELLRARSLQLRSAA